MASQKKDAIREWAKFLNPDSLKGNLIAASLFLAAYETLKYSIVEQSRNFFMHGFDKNNKLFNDNYYNNILSLDKNPLQASLLWLKNLGVFGEDDLSLVNQIREHRNDLAHNLQNFVLDADKKINVQLLESIYELTTKIDRWWILEVEIPTNPEFDGQMVDAEEIQSGNMIFLQLMIHIATGEESSACWEEFQRLLNRSHRPNDSHV